MLRREQTAPKAVEFYNDKVEELGNNLKDLEKVVQSKSTNLKVIEDGERGPPIYNPNPDPYSMLTSYATASLETEGYGWRGGDNSSRW